MRDSILKILTFILGWVLMLSFQLLFYIDSFLKKPVGKSYVFSIVGDVLDSCEKNIDEGATKDVPFDVLEVILELSDRENFLKALYEGFTILATDYPAIVFVGDRKAVAFV